MIAKWIKFVFCWAESLIDTMPVEWERNLSYPGVSGPYPAIAGYSWLSGYSRIQPDMGRYEAPRHVRSHRYSVLADNEAHTSSHSPVLTTGASAAAWSKAYASSPAPTDGSQIAHIERSCSAEGWVCDTRA